MDGEAQLRYGHYPRATQEIVHHSSRSSMFRCLVLCWGSIVFLGLAFYAGVAAQSQKQVDWFWSGLGVNADSGIELEYDEGDSIMDMYSDDIASTYDETNKTSAAYELHRTTEEEKIPHQQQQQEESHQKHPSDVDRAYSLEPTLVPLTLIFFWCGQRQFKFANYLSLKSGIRFMRPDKILFFYSEMPEIDKRMYNTWLLELAKEEPFLTMVKFNQSESHTCCAEDKPTAECVQQKILEHGGMFIGQRTIMTKNPDMNVNFLDALDQETGEGVVIAQTGLSKGTVQLGKQSRYKELCKDITSNKSGAFMNMMDALSPKDIWFKNDPFSSLIRDIFYETPDIQLPRKSSDVLAPNIAHMVWLGGGNMNFLFYMSVLSLVFVAKVDRVYIHGDLPPSGAYWNRVKNNTNITYRHRNFFKKSVFGQDIHTASHWSDVLRADILYKYGGIYVDTDAIFLRPLEEEIRSYDAVASYSVANRQPYPDSISSGVLVGKPRTKFWKLFQDSMSDFHTTRKLFNPLLVPYKIKERNPWLLHIDQRIMTICIKTKCLPLWIPNYNSIADEVLIRKVWKEGYSLHFCANDKFTPPEFRSESYLRNQQTTGPYADIGRFILKEASQL